MENNEYAKVGQPAPQFNMLSTKNLKTLDEAVTLEDYKGKWLILFFYPYDFSFVCPTEIRALSARYEEFKDLNTEILGVSTDSVYSHKAWLQSPEEDNGIQGTKYLLASDNNHAVSEAYGVLVKEEGAALRGLFIIDPGWHPAIFRHPQYGCRPQCGRNLTCPGSAPGWRPVRR